jgi:hypothetical protein
LLALPNLLNHPSAVFLQTTCLIFPARIFDPAKHSFNPLKNIDYRKARPLCRCPDGGVRPVLRGKAIEEAMLKRKFIPKSSKLPVYFYVDEASEYYGKEPRVAKIIDRLGKPGLATIFAAQGTDHFSPEVLTAMQRAAVQAWTLEWPIVNISLNRKEPMQVHVSRTELASLPSISEPEFESILFAYAR